MPDAGRLFVRSRIGKKIFLTFLLIVALPLVGISLLSREISEYVLTRSTDQLLRDSTKAVGLNLLDRLRSGEAMLRIMNSANGTGIKNSDAARRADIIFSEIQFPVDNQAIRRGASIIRVISSGSSGLQDVEIIISDEASGKVAIGILNQDYLWENLESAFYTLCVEGGEWRTPHCHGPQLPSAATVINSRPLYFRPYMNGEPWQLKAVAAPNVADYLPVKLGAIFAYAAALSLLLALSVSALFIRRATKPLDALIAATGAVRRGEFSHRIPLGGLRDEFIDVADSFNSMALTIGDDIAFMKMLSEMDRAILARSPLGVTVSLGLSRFAGHAAGRGWSIYVFRDQQDTAEVFTLDGSGTVRRTPDILVEGGYDGVAQRGTAIAIVDTTAVMLVGVEPAELTQELMLELEAVKSKIAIAVSSEQHEHILVSRAAHDSLTHLLNRLGLVDKLGGLIAQPFDRSLFAVVYLDLDGFKEVNDAYGHDVGDRLLKKVADRISASLERSELALARMGGDEFVFLLPIDEANSYYKRVEAVLHDLQRVFNVDELQIQVGASMGVARFPADGENQSDLLKCADLAMYAAKSNGRNQIVYFERSLNSAAAERIELRRDLAIALAQNQFYVVYQPRVSSGDLAHASAEALIRWQHPTHGNIPPDKFISLAEESGQILDIGYWVLAEAANQMNEWVKNGSNSIKKVSVNISPIQLMADDFLTTVENIVARSGAAISTIELEVTEGALIKDIDKATKKLNRLRELGFSIALDDFGVGYSAMSYLSVLPFDTLKIDKSFVSRLGLEDSAYAIASAIVALGKALRKNIVAEGVETQEQAQKLIALGVDELQGYLYSKPLRPKDLDGLLKGDAVKRLP